MRKRPPYLWTALLAAFVLFPMFFFMKRDRAVGLMESAPSVVAVEDYEAEEYLNLPPAAIGDLSADRYQQCIERISSLPMRFYRLWYRSDGHKVQAIIGLPASLDATQRYPLIVYNRGGNRALGYFNVCFLNDFVDFGATLGEAVVIAPQYRGSPGSEGNDEFGGEDVNDVVNAVNVTESFSFINPSQRFIVGWSRGGMMTYLTLKRDQRFNAAVVIAGPTDLEEGERARPEMKELDAALMPGYSEKRAEVLAERSALQWPERINTPVLIVHGTKDWRVSVDDAKRMAEALEKLNKPHRLVTYEGSDHDLDGVYKKMLSEVGDWFHAHLTERASH